LPVASCQLVIVFNWQLTTFMESGSTTADTPQARSYNHLRRVLGIADFLLSLAGLIVLLAAGWTRDLRDAAFFLAGQNYLLSVFFYVFMLALLSKALGIGLDFYSFRVEQRYGLSYQKLRSWLWDETKGLLVGLVLGTIIVELLYFIIRQTTWWWMIAWAMFLVLMVFFAQIAPVVLFPIFYKFKPLEREELKRRLAHLSESAGMRVRGVYEWKLSEKSKKANAALTGLGRTRRIILADTLLENYSDDEIEAVLAHELGHHVHRHILKSILVQALVTFAGFWAAARVLHFSERQHGILSLGVGGLKDFDFANLPLLALVSTVISFLLIPALNAWSRFNERQADRYAFRSIPQVAPFISSMNKLADQNLAERSPSKLVEFFFHSHPAISKRIAAAEHWEASQKSAKN
jgi:STE24 endopeptidase